MQTIKIPYDTSYLNGHLETAEIAGILEAKEYMPKLTASEIIQTALDHPIASKSLAQLVINKTDMVIITSDHTRPVPSNITLPIILANIREANPAIKITILVATGYHRSPTKSEMLNKFGQQLIENEHFVIHKDFDDTAMEFVGILPSGGELHLNKLILNTQLLIAEGFIEPHFFAGFSGGRKSVLPGVASANTIMANHCSEFINSPYAIQGNLLNNPIHEDMIWACLQVKLQFIFNVVLNHKQEVIYAVAGHYDLAHLKGCEFVNNLMRVQAIMADIVISSNGGYPLDQNIYQAVKGITTAAQTCNKGGIIIMVASCKDGHGGEDFYQALKKANSAQQLHQDILNIPMSQTNPDQWEYQILAKILQQHQVIFVSQHLSDDLFKQMHMHHRSTIDDAIIFAKQLLNKPTKITIIPDGIGIIINPE